MGVIVFGSINMDLVTQTPRLPKPGETLTGHRFFTASGGKGANQAVASARMGVSTYMIGQVGDDVFGQTLRSSLEGYGVNVANVTIHAGQSSGIAAIAVDDNAENTIIVVPGANGDVGSADLQKLEAQVSSAQVLLVQLEVPLTSVQSAIQIAQRNKLTIILDPAPAHPLPDDLYPLIDIITPNETETAMLVGFPVNDPASIREAGKILLDRGVRNAVIKLGSKGVYWTNGTQSQFLDAYSVKAIDTVAAGDAFNGALGAALSEGLDLAEALRWGMATGAISTTRPGAQPSMPNRQEVLALMNEQKR